jgi:hypothetical protein
MKRVDRLRAYINQPERPPRKKKTSEAAAQKSARLAAKKIRLVSEARAMLKKLETLPLDNDLMRQRDLLVAELWALRHARREIKGKPVEVLQ